MTNENSQYPQNGEYAQGGQYPQNGGYAQYPQNGQQFQGHPQGGAHPHSGYPQQQWQQTEPPKKKNFFVRHKILTGVLALGLVAGIAAAAGGGSKDGGSSNAGSPTSAAAPAKSGSAASSGGQSSAAAQEKKDALPALGTPVTDGKFTFTVSRVERNVPSIGGQYMNKKAQGSYTLVHITVKNTGTDAQSLMADSQKAYDANGVGYEATSDGAFYIEGNDTLFTEINPGNTLKGILVFDTPAGTKLTKVRLHDSMFSNGVETSL